MKKILISLLTCLAIILNISDTNAYVSTVTQSSLSRVPAGGNVRISRDGYQNYIHADGGWYSQAYMFRVSVTGGEHAGKSTLGYCGDLASHVPSSTPGTITAAGESVTTTGWWGQTKYNSGATTLAQSLYAFYGYGWNGGDMTEYYWEATAQLVWGLQVSPKLENMYWNYGNSQISSAMQVIQGRVNRYKTNPNLKIYRQNGTEYSDSVRVTNGEILKIVDSNNVIDMYKINSSSGFQYVNASGQPMNSTDISSNTFYLKVVDYIEEPTISFSLQDKYYGTGLEMDGFNAYSSGIEQYVVVRGDIPNKSLSLSVKAELLGTLKIKKSVGANANLLNIYPQYFSLAGAEYTVYDSSNTVVGKFTTDANGDAPVMSLKAGNYTLKETKAPKGFRKNEGTYSLTILPGVVTSLTATDTPILKDNIVVDPPTLLIQKNNTFGKKIPDVQFRFDYYTSSFTAIQNKTGSIVRTWTFKSDTNGRIAYDASHKISGDELYSAESGRKIMPPGTYIITETKAPAGYDLADPIILNISINEANNGYSFNFYDKDGNRRDGNINVGVNVVDRAFGFVQFKKNSTNALTEKSMPLAGAEFTIYEDSAGNIIAKDMVTGKNAIATIGNDNLSNIIALEPGKAYWYQETKVPNGYTGDQSIKKMPEIYEYTEDITDIQTVKARIIKETNTPDSGKMKIKKVSTNTAYGENHPLYGAKFGIYLNAECTSKYNELETYWDGTSYVTDEMEIPLYTSYWIKETKAPEGYKENSEIKEITLTAEDFGTAKVVEFADEPDNGYGKLVKTSTIPEYAQTFPLYKAEFVIYDSKGREMIGKKLVTDKNGVSNTVELPSGDYYAIETVVPEGYEADLNRRINFTINPLETTTITATNSPIYEYFTLNKRYSGPTKPADTSTITYSIISDYITRYPFTGAKYTIYTTQAGAQNKDATLIAKTSDGVNAVLITDADGNTNTITMKRGNYWVRETEQPTGYSLDNTVYPIVLNEPNETYTLTVQELPDLGIIQIYKDSTDATYKADNPVAGAVYGVYSDAQCTVKVSDMEIQANGYSPELIVQAGTYYIKEITPASGYKLDTDVYEVTVGGAIKAVKKVYDAPSRTRVKLRKLTTTADSEYITMYPISGAIYTIYKNGTAGNINEGGAVSQSTGLTLVTEADGNSQWVSLDRGVYYIKETYAPNGWLIDPMVYRVDLSDVNSFEFEVSELPKLGKIKLLKYREGTTTPISGITFNISGTTAENESFSVMLTTNADGEIEEYIPYGEYTMTEQPAPDKGVITNNTVWNVHIEHGETKTLIDGVTNSGDYAVIYNQMIITGNLTFYKADKAHTLLSGAQFWIESVGETLYGNTFYSQINESSTGKFEISGLEPGTYHLSEIKAPTGYKLDETVRTVTVSNTGQVTISPIVNYNSRFEITNEKVQGLQIKKQDPDNTGLKLVGATFTLTGESKYGTIYNLEATTDANGYASFNNLEVTDSYYVLKETVAPTANDGGNTVEYTLPNVTYKVYVTDSGVTIEGLTKSGDYFIVPNSPKGGKITILKEWVDNNNADNTRPNDITIHVSNYRNDMYNIVYAGNGSTTYPVTGSVAEQDVAKGSSANARNNGFTRTGYTFVGWNTNPNATTAEYSPGDSITPTKHMVLYAIWQGNTYTVKFNKNITSARGTMANQTFTVGIEQALNPNAFWLGYNE